MIDTIYFYNQTKYQPESQDTSINFFGNPETTIFVEINCYYLLVEGRCNIIMKYCDRIFKIKQGSDEGVVKELTGSDVGAWEGAVASSIENDGPAIPFDIKMTLVSNDIREKQLKDLSVSDFKVLNRPIIETDYGCLGIASMVFPEKWIDRSSFGTTRIN